MRAPVGLWLLWTAVSCGSQTAADNIPAAASQGDETTPQEPQPQQAQPLAAEPLAKPAARSGPGTVTAVALVDDKPVPANIRVLDQTGAVRAEGASGTPIQLAAGTYRVEIGISDASAMADKPTQWRALTLTSGSQSRLEEPFRWAKISLNVLVGGRSQPGALVKLLRDGQVVAELKSGASPVAITPGRYEADVQLKGSSIRVKGLQFPAGATQTVPVHAQF